MMWASLAGSWSHARTLLATGKVRFFDLTPRRPRKARPSRKPSPIAKPHVLSGWVASQSNRRGKRTVRRYVLTLEAVDDDTGRKVWTFTHAITKVIKGSVSW
jgi:hypothetical protein